MTARRPRGEGSLFYSERRDCWVGVADLGMDLATRKRIRRTVTAKTKTRARQKLADLLATARAAGTVPRGDLTVGHLIDDLLAHPPDAWKSPISAEVNTRHARRIKAAIGPVKVMRLTVDQVEALLVGMAADGYATSTIRNTRALLRRALRRAERDHGLSRNVADLASVPGGTRRQSRSMTPEQVTKLLSLELTPWWRAYLSCAFMLGLRPGELHGLSWEDVDFDAGVVRVRHSLRYFGGKYQLADLKTQSSRRTIRMPDAVATALQAQRKDQLKKRMQSALWQDQGLVFCSRTGTPRKRMATDKRFKQLCEIAGLGGDWQLRETRHTFVSVLSLSGVSIEHIADAAGHANSRVTQIVYRHQLSDEIASAATVWNAITAVNADGETG